MTIPRSPRIFERLHQDIQHNIGNAIKTSEARTRQAMSAMQFWPQTLTTDLEIPEGQQLTLDFLTVNEGATLYVNGHLCILSWLRDLGTVVIGENGSLRIRGEG
jgi:hypothetical protein